ncbi:substrate-binding periplasmic protein [Paucibacter soli]|uniref:substrate-binding periplasmic protein n=1 Tax=Paucibacter soli TaxID=3133433 RepID=UPI0030B4072C
MRRAALSLALAAGLLPAAAPAQQALEPAQGQVLRFFVPETWTMPLGELEARGTSRQLLRGLGLDWQRALAEAVGASAEAVVAPHKRLEYLVQLQAFDVLCFMNPAWVKAELGLQWLPPFMEVDERLVAGPGQADISHLAELRGHSVGTVASYHYPALERVFASGMARRENASTERQVLEMLLRGRSDFAVMRSMDLQYLQRHDPATRELKLSSLVITREQFHCATVPGGRAQPQPLRLAQERLLKAGVLERLRASYR